MIDFLKRIANELNDELSSFNVKAECSIVDNGNSLAKIRILIPKENILNGLPFVLSLGTEFDSNEHSIESIFYTLKNDALEMTKQYCKNNFCEAIKTII